MFDRYKLVKTNGKITIILFDADNFLVEKISNIDIDKARELVTDIINADMSSKPYTVEHVLRYTMRETSELLTSTTKQITIRKDVALMLANDILKWLNEKSSEAEV